MLILITLEDCQGVPVRSTDMVWSRAGRPDDGGRSRLTEADFKLATTVGMNRHENPCCAAERSSRDSVSAPIYLGLRSVQCEIFRTSFA